MKVKERPILFSGPMVNAILAENKIMTRRIMKKQPHSKPLPRERWGEAHRAEGMSAAPDHYFPFEGVDGRSHYAFQCPYGKIGDRLWVRETHAIVPATAYRKSTDDGVNSIPHILSPDKKWWAVYKQGWTRSPNTWKPSIFMPRWASRITLEITGIRNERLQDITDNDIMAEGLDHYNIYDIISKQANKIKSKPHHWIRGKDGCEEGSFCYNCGSKEVKRLNKKAGKSPDDDDAYFLDGGWEHFERDCQGFCEKCECYLDTTILGVEQELEHFSTFPFNAKSPDDCYALQQLLSSVGFYGEIISPLKKLAWRAVWDTINGDRANFESNPWVWVISFKKI